MKSPRSFLLLLAIVVATTRASGSGDQVVRRATSINNSTDVDINDGCPLCTCDVVPSSTTSNDIIEASILMLDVQVSLIK